MVKGTIGRVLAVRDAVDLLVWEVEIATTFYGSNYQRAYAWLWEGDAVFWREEVPFGTRPGPQTPRRALRARWTNRDQSARMIVPRDQKFEFTTDLPGDALDRIEEYRDGGRLFVRIEGKLSVAFAGPSKARESHDEIAGILNDLGRSMVDSSRVYAVDICTILKEISRDTWSESILAKLRTPGRHILEVRVPIGQAAGDAAAAAIQSHRAAQLAFDQGRYEETLGACAQALGQIDQLMERIEASYGKGCREVVAEQLRATRDLCAPSSSQAKMRVDRALAHHLLVVTSSLLGFATS